jgi:membrane protein
MSPESTSEANRGTESHPRSAGRALTERSWKDYVAVLKQSGQAFADDNASRLAAALACYTLLSMAPLVVLCVAIAGLFFGREAAQGQIAQELGSVVGESGAKAIESVVANAKNPGSGILASIGGVAVLLFGASGLFGELQSSLNTVWSVEPKPGRGIWGVIKDRFFSFTMVLGVGFLLLVSLVVSAALAALGRHLVSVLPLAPVWHVVNTLLSLVVAALIFALIFKVIPDAKIRWQDVWMGAFVTAILFSLGRLLLGLYIGHSGVSSSYGAAGSIVALVIWVYYSAQILLFGAEFTEAHAARFGSRIEPTENAIPIGGEKEPEHVESTHS